MLLSKLKPTTLYGVENDSYLNHRSLESKYLSEEQHARKHQRGTKSVQRSSPQKLVVRQSGYESPKEHYKAQHVEEIPRILTVVMPVSP